MADEETLIAGEGEANGALSLPILDEDAKRRARTPSPSRSIATDFAISSQMSRLSFLTTMHEVAEHVDQAFITVDELNCHIKVLEEQWTRFSNEHEKLGSSGRRALFKLPYMVDKVYEQGFHLYRIAHARFHSIIAQLNERAIIQSPNSSCSNQPTAIQQRKLPEITIQPFSGDYPEWPAFRDLFKSMVIDNEQISDVERMHYLKTSLRQSAAQLIATLPLQGDSFASAWTMLIARFENKRLLVSAHLDRIIGDRSLIKCTAQDLNKLLSSLAESLNALRTQGLPVDQWDAILVHLITQRLGHPLIEAWENKIGSSSDLPSLDQLKEFLWARARAQERLEMTHATTQSSPANKSTSSGRPTPRSSHPATAHAASTARYHVKPQYPCDQCGGDHYIVTCAKFMSCTPQARRGVAVTHRLCYNCLGHHNSSSCHSTKTCKICGQKHHPMLHVTPPSTTTTQQASASSSTQ